VIDDLIRRLILQHADATALKNAAQKQGMQTLAADGWAKVRAGLTSPQEVFRVTQEEE
jgi:type II secretory ATPase GspE/PulE/Tfp pilus assembly ATPase PilB-like protein